MLDNEPSRPNPGVWNFSAAHAASLPAKITGADVGFGGFLTDMAVRIFAATATLPNANVGCDAVSLHQAVLDEPADRLRLDSDTRQLMWSCKPLHAPATSLRSWLASCSVHHCALFHMEVHLSFTFAAQRLLVLSGVEFGELILQECLL